MSRPRLIALLLALGTLVVFLPVGSFQFINYDDDDYVTGNVMVQGGLTPAGVKWAFTTFHASNWHPLTWLSHMADCELFKLNAGAHHFGNVFLHAASAALLFVLLLLLKGKIWPAALVAALFAWHPLHVESVAWISERKDVLSTFCALLALIAYVRFAQERMGARSQEQGESNQTNASPGSKFYWLALLCFALGLMAKPMLVTLPFLLLLLDYWPLKRFPLSAFGSPLLIEKIPFFALAAASSVVTFLAQQRGEAVVSLARVSLRHRLENAPVAVVDYLLKLFWPADLCAIYPMPEQISAWKIALSATVLILISAAAWHWRKVKPCFLVGWLWFLGTLVPVIGLVQVGGAAMADRYTYIPSIGIFLALVFFMMEFAGKSRRRKIISAGLAIAALIACILATQNQLRFWRDSETLFRHAVAVMPNNEIALINLGSALELQNRLNEALAIDRQAEELKTGRYQLHNNLGNLLAKLGRHEESLAEYHEAIRLRPANAMLRAITGSELAALGRFDEALTLFAAAEKLDPHYAWPHIEIAKVLFKLGSDDKAVDELRAALRLEPDSFQILATTAYYLAANENAAARDGKNALGLALKANEISGRSQPMVFDVLGMACAENGDFTNAQICAENALTLATAAKLKSLEPLQQRLELYKNKKPWRESFRATNAPAKN